MVVENLFKEKWIEKRPIYSLFLGVIFTSISFFTAYVLFRMTPSFVGISTILFCVILVLYGINQLFDLEEKEETEEHLGFFREHEEVIDFFLYFFIGVFITLFVIALIQPAFVFSQSDLRGTSREMISQSKNIPPPPVAEELLGKKISPSFLNYEVYSIFKNNLYVMVVSFLLSLFYNSGAIFLIVLNASIFASALADVVRARFISGDFFFSSGFMLCNLSVMFFHMIPEASSYCLAAIAGGVLSKAFLKEKIFSHRFKLVLRDSFILMIMAIFVLFFAAIVEMKISKQLFTSNVCLTNSFYVILSAIALIFIIAVLELIRKKKLLKSH